MTSAKQDRGCFAEARTGRMEIFRLLFLYLPSDLATLHQPEKLKRQKLERRKEIHPGSECVLTAA